MPLPASSAFGRMIVLLWFLVLLPSTRADVRLPALFSDHMVLQSGISVPVWGWADPGEEVQIHIAGQSRKTTADAQGRWRATLAPLNGHTEPLQLKVQGKNILTIQDVLVGEVWLASGQSNMAMQVQRCNDFEKEKAAADFPKIRMFTVTSGPATKPQENCEGKWIVCSPNTVGSFSGTAYFFGRELFKELKQPIGLINSSVGGTAIESWTSEEANRSKPELTPIYERWNRLIQEYQPEKAKAKYEKDLMNWHENVKKAKEAKLPPPPRPREPVPPREDRNYPANLFNGKIAPLIPFAIRGVIWYQGEHNTRADCAYLYRIQLPLLVADWRSRWGQGEFAFAWVQLPNFQGGNNRWPIVREAMLESLRVVPNSGMAITLDVGDPKDIHPTNKQEVGKRLAAWALATQYKKPMPFCGPLLESHRVEKSQIVLKFTHTEGGLKSRGETLVGFEIAGADKVWRPAKAEITANGEVVVRSAVVDEPLAVRYAWSNNPEASLINGAGLPASPFRTQKWD